MRNNRTAILLAVAVIGCIFAWAGCVLIRDLLLGTGVLLPAASFPTSDERYLEKARSRVQIGDNRSNAIRALSDAWYRSECYTPESNVVRDLFFYGPHDQDGVTVILVTSEGSYNEHEKVVFIGRLENYMLHLYEDCDPPPSHAFCEATPDPPLLDNEDESLR